MNEKWMNDMRNRMADRKRKAPAGLLGDIRKEMDRRGLVTPVRRPDNARTVGLWPKRIAAAALVLVLGGAGWWWLQTQKGTAPTVADSSVPAQTPPDSGQSAPAADRELPSGPGEAILRSGRRYVAADRRSATVSAADDLQPDRTEAVNGPKTDSASPEVTEPQPPQPAGPAPKQPSRPHATPHTPTCSDRPQRTLAYSRPSRPSAFTASLHYSGVMASQAEARQGMTLAAADPIGYYDRTMAFTAAKRNMTTEPRFVTKTDYGQPVKFGISLGYRLTDRWSVRTGVDYSYLSSNTVTTTGQIENKTHQQLHYIGVPVSASYTLWRKRNAHVYLNGGGEVEKLVKGSSLKSGNSGQAAVHSDVKEARPQFSVNAAVGAEYSFLHCVSVYAEPGMSYYFDNKSGVDNIYKDKKLNFSFNVGLRLNIGQ